MMNLTINHLLTELELDRLVPMTRDLLKLALNYSSVPSKLRALGNKEDSTEAPTWDKLNILKDSIVLLRGYYLTWDNFRFVLKETEPAKQVEGGIEQVEYGDILDHEWIMPSEVQKSRISPSLTSSIPPSTFSQVQFL